jgi:hypothetical protein
MKQIEKFYPEEVLIEKVQNKEFGWLEYVTHYSNEWKEEFEAYCERANRPQSEAAAKDFMDYVQQCMDSALADGEA